MIMLYFSATGNSKYTAELFCGHMNAPCYSIEEEIDFTQLIAAADTVGFCYPIYGSRAPRLLREFVTAHMESLQDKKLIIFCTQMYFSGDGARALTDLFPRGRAEVIYAEHFLMPNNVCNLFFMPLPDEKRIQWYLTQTAKKMKIVCEDIQNGKIKKRGFNPGSRALGLIQGAFLPGIERRARNKVWIDADCNQCGLCVSICPMDNFESGNGNIETRGNCMICYRCVNRCPQQAISVFLRGKVRKQYTGI
ncbi:MAG: EFR1 family ferrodoxin [Oscillospiraceae bacterium]|nr:EFR1 family ferrodoxin [Oscillospiraceae bacterium]